MNDIDFAAEVLAALPYNANEQQVAVVAALARFCCKDDAAESAFILNGYAGTGKTSLTGALVKTLRAHKRQVVLLAPTGRAAKVFSANSGGITASTIHRKIYRHNPDATPGVYTPPLPADNRLMNAVFIVDEASMIGTADERGTDLLDDLITYVYAGIGCRLILIGDTAQLPPVGSDRSPAMKADVLRRLGLKVTQATLTETARQAADSGILFNATRLRKIMVLAAKAEPGKAPVPKLRTAGFDDVKIVDPTDLPEIISDAYSASPDGEAGSILITRSNKRAAEYNAAIRAAVLYREEEISRGDMLIVSRNHYFRKKVKTLDFVANGDILTVSRVYGTEVRYGLRFADVELEISSPENPSETINFDIKILLDTLADPSAGLSQEDWNKLYYGIMADDERYGATDLTARAHGIMRDPYWTALHVKYAYAVTCHKAQGGQWENVFVDLSYIPDDALGLTLYRWLYTAVTRATKRLYLIAPPEAIIK
ncbi:MAG: AAA family ATPase [Muribaculaceae bacterium]|nr:AAA family ATPase [Muribaculaceae bacterium]